MNAIPQWEQPAPVQRGIGFNAALAAIDASFAPRAPFVPVDQVTFWTAELAKAEAALTAKREWLIESRMAGTPFYNDACETGEVAFCNRMLVLAVAS